MDRQLDRAAALASLRERWGAAAPRPATEVFGALAAAPRVIPESRLHAVMAPPAHPATTPGRPALVPLPGLAPAAPPARPQPVDPDRVLPTGFPDLDALLATGGLPRAGTVALVGSGSSGVTTLALRAVAEAQAAGGLAAWVDLPRSLDPVEAVARGVRPEWLAVLVPDGMPEALAMTGSLLQARAVDVVVLDLAAATAARPVPSPDTRSAAAISRPGTGSGARAAAATAARPVPGPSRHEAHPPRPAGRAPRPADQLARLAAFARRAGALLLILVPPEAPASLRAAVGEGAGLRLELRHRGWIRLGREVVGQRTEARVARDRHGAPDRRAELRILYAEGGPRDRCLRLPELLVEEAAAHAPPDVRSAPPLPMVPPLPLEIAATGRAAAAAVASRGGEAPPGPALTFTRVRSSSDAPAPPLLAAPRHPARPDARSRRARERTRDPGRAAVG